VESVPAESWARLLTTLGITAETVVGVDPELETAIRTLAHHVGSAGMAPEFTRRLPHLEDTDSPFLALTDCVLAYTRSYANGVDGDELELLRDALATVARCREEVAHLRATKSEHGTSLELTGLTFRLLQMLDRLEVLLHLTDPVERDFQLAATRLFKEIVRAERTRNDVVPHVRERADLLAYQVVEHAARKGAKYVTSGWRDYSAFFVASLGGGFIVAIFSFVKTWLGGLGLPLGVEGLLYGLNYSLCFVLIYLTGSALATKQPAMTANTIARALGHSDDPQLDGLEQLVVRVWRSQFISFAGNLAMALPTAFLVSELWFRSTGATVATPDAAVSMLEALHPWRSGTVVFAAIAGVFLFRSGLISGWVDNRLVYSRVRDRVAVHPWLRRAAGERRAGAVADFVDRNLGIVTGNLFLGFALGSTGTLGEILGLPLDIRHIAFASAEFGTALEILHLDVGPAVLVPVALGVVAIGLANFLVSFGLSLVTAMESRRITWRETRALLARLGQSVRARPTDWFFPPRGARSDAA
jgi:site-specific recombinase